MSAMFAATPKPPYYAVIFTSQRSAVTAAYDDTAERMVALAQLQPGFLGVESVRGTDGLGITVSYWESEAAIANWKQHGEHSLAREQGRKSWYAAFETRVARVERAYGQQRPGLRFVPAGEADKPYILEQTRLNLPLRALGNWGVEQLEQDWPLLQNHLLYLDRDRIGILRWRLRDESLHISDFQIEAAYRNRGLGSQAMLQFAQLARAQGHARVSLRVFHDNPARRLYERLGYAEIERSDHWAVLAKSV